MFGVLKVSIKVVTAFVLTICFIQAAEAQSYSVDQFPPGYLNKDAEAKVSKENKSKASKTETSPSPTDWGNRLEDMTRTKKEHAVKKASKEPKVKTPPHKKRKASIRKKTSSAKKAVVASAIYEAFDELKAAKAAQYKRAAKDDELSNRLKKFKSSSRPRSLPKPNRQLSTAASKSSISLVVAAEPESHFQSAIKHLARLHDQHSIPVSEVRIVHGNFSPSTIFSSLVKTPELAKIMQKLTSSGTGIKPAASIPKALKVQSSPVWLVYHEGKTHIFEGYNYPQELFDAHGEFVGADIDIKGN